MNKKYEELKKIVPTLKSATPLELAKLSNLNINGYVKEKLLEKVKAAEKLGKIEDKIGKIGGVSLKGIGLSDISKISSGDISGLAKGKIAEKIGGIAEVQKVQAAAGEITGAITSLGEVIKMIEDILTPEVIQIKPFNIDKLLNLEIISEINDHVRVNLRASLFSADGIKYIEATSENKLEIKRRGDLLFEGYLEKVGTTVINHDYVLEVEAVSYSKLLDVKKKTRSFQDVAMTYEELIKEVLTGSEAKYSVESRFSSKSIGEVLIQYEETDWEFLKRVLSREKEEILVSSLQNHIQFGINNDGNLIELWNEYLTIERDLKRYKDIQKNVDSSVAILGVPVIELSSRKNIFAGNRVKLTPPVGAEILSEKNWLANKGYVARKSIISYEKKELKSYTTLYSREEYIPYEIKNEKMAGICFTAQVLKVEGNRVKVKFDFDEKADESKSYLFPYVTPYSTEGNTGFYFMPEIGDKVLLKFTEHKGKSGIVLNNIMSSNEKNDPEIKKITAFKKKIYFEKEDIVLSTEDDKTLIKISETDGITIESDREIEIKADGDMEAISVGEMTISGNSGVSFKVGGTIVEAGNGALSAKGGKINWSSSKGTNKGVISIPKKLGESDQTSICRADPIDMSTGNFYTSKTDMIIEGKEELVFSRFYNSMGKWKGSLGNKWQHNYEISLSQTENREIEITYSNGRVESYKENGNGTIESTSNPYNTLTREEGCWMLYTAEGTTYRFDRNGRLSRIEKKSGSRITLTHDRDKLVRISNRSGYINLIYEGKYLVKIEDMTGRKTEYKYEWNNLTEITDVDGNTSKIEYDKNSNIYRMYDGAGELELQNIYDEQNRTVEQITADGYKSKLKYNDTTQETIYTERTGEEQIYRKDSMGRIFEREYLNGTEKLTFNDKSEITEYIDKNGNKYKYEYDDQGNICKEINPLGEVSEFSYNLTGNLIKTVNPDGSIYEYNYDSKGNLHATLDPEGRIVKTRYDEEGNMRAIIYPDGSETEFTYDEKGNIEEVKDGEGYVTKYKYDTLNRVSEITRANGNKISYEYTNSGKITTVKFGDNSRKEIIYNERGFVSRETDEAGNSVNYKYNRAGNLSERIDENGDITKYEYDAMWNICKIIKPDGSEIKYSYNKSNLLQMTEDEEGYSEYMLYDSNGNLTDYADRNEKVSTREYDALNRIVKSTTPNGAETEFEYRYDGKLKKVTDALKGTEEFEYNRAGELTEVKQNGTKVKEYRYNLKGYIESEKDSEGNEKRYEYSKNDNLTAVIYPDGNREEMSYDGNSNLILHRDRAGGETKYEYDKRDRLIKITDPMGSKKEIEYSLTGKVKSVTDELQRKTEYIYDKTGKLTGVIDAEGGKKEYKYNKTGKLIEIHSWNSDADRSNPIINKYMYDRRGMLTEEINPLNNVKSYKYDGNGNLVTMTDEDGITAKYEYDAVNNLIKTEYNRELNTEYSYDILNRVTKIEKDNDQTRYEYDKRGRLSKVRELNDKVTEYRWSNNGQKTKIIYPDGTKINYGYNDNGNLTTIKENDNATARYIYDKAGRLTGKELGNGIKTGYEYDPMLRLKKLTTFDKENNISDEYSYEYDRAGNKIKAEKRREDRTSVYHYSYDKLDRIIKVTDEKKLSEIYSYDRAGNRISKEKRDEIGNILSQEKYIYDRQNKLISADGLKELLGDKVYGTVRFEYDKRGNTTRIKDSSKVIGEYEFSKENLLAKATNRNGEVTTFTYDGAGRRVRVKVENPNEKLTKEYKYINDPTTPYSTILMRYGKDKQTEKYIHGIGHESTEKLNQWKETEKTFYTHNELGSQIREYDDKGTSTNSYEYDIFGVPSFREDSYNYTGYTNDTSTNLMFAQARYYLPETGRFISEDSYKGTQNDIQSQNRYIYCTNNPLKYIDPSGHINTMPSAISVDEDYLKNYKYKEVSDNYISDTINGKIKEIAVTEVGKEIWRSSKNTASSQLKMIPEATTMLKSGGRFLTTIAKINPVVDFFTVARTLNPQEDSELIKQWEEVYGKNKDHFEEPIIIIFKRNKNHSATEFTRQLKMQEKGLNDLTVDQYLKNRAEYDNKGRSAEGKKAQEKARKKAYNDKVIELREKGLSKAEAEKKAAEWLKTQAALHNPDQIAGGFASNVTGVGCSRINSSIGSQWKNRIDALDKAVENMSKNMTEAEKKATKLNIRLIEY